MRTRYKKERVVALERLPESYILIKYGCGISDKTCLTAFIKQRLITTI